MTFSGRFSVGGDGDGDGGRGRGRGRGQGQGQGHVPPFILMPCMM